MAGIQLFILRHAVAEARDPQRWPDDTGRPLTADGARKMAIAARGMRALGLRFDLILTSPLERARHTAVIVAHALRPSHEPALAPALAPGGSPQEILAAIPGGGASGRVLLVGHEPGLTRLASALLLSGGHELPIELRKGGLIRIDFDGPPRPGRGRMLYHLKPRMLRLMAKPAP